MTVTPKDILSNIISWSTLAGNVKQLSDWEYLVSTHPENVNDPGAGIMAVDDYFVANWGGLYSITNISGENITVNDDFQTGRAPNTGLAGIVFRSICNGSSQWLPPIRYEVLDRSAKSYLETIVNSYLFYNDPNPRRFPFTNTELPTISGYQSDRTDPENALKTINYAELYGQDPLPQVRSIIVLDANNSYQLQQMPLFTFIDGLLDTIYFDMTGNPSSGYLIISKS
jgi:hypothetical protein